MIVFKEVLANIANMANVEKYEIESIHLTNEEVLKRLIIAKSDLNHEYAIKLEDGKRLVDGDVLANENNKLVVVRLELADVLIITSDSIGNIAMIAHNLGNRHMPAQFNENEMIVPYDYLVEEYLQEIKAQYERKKIKLKEAFRHCEAAR